MPMTEQEEGKYVFAQDLTRMRIALEVLREIIHDDFKVDEIRTNLYQQISDAFKKLSKE